MAWVITRLCRDCVDQACVDVCPVDAIHGPAEAVRRKPQPPLQLFIDPDQCICCSACEPECPVGAIYERDDVPAEFREDVDRNAAFFEKKAQ